MGCRGPYHRPIDINKTRLATEAVVNARNKAAPDQCHNANVVKLIANIVDTLRVIGHEMVRSRHAETCRRAAEEAGKD